MPGLAGTLVRGGIRSNCRVYEARKGVSVIPGYLCCRVHVRTHVIVFCPLVASPYQICNRKRPQRLNSDCKNLLFLPPVRKFEFVYTGLIHRPCSAYLSVIKPAKGNGIAHTVFENRANGGICRPVGCRNNRTRKSWQVFPISGKRLNLYGKIRTLISRSRGTGLYPQVIRDY